MDITLFGFTIVTAVIGYIAFSKCDGKMTPQGFRVHHASAVVFGLGLLVLLFVGVVWYWSFRVHQDPTWMNVTAYLIQGCLTTAAGGTTMLLTRRHHSL